MINAVLIDDERPALKLLEHLLKEYKEINVIASFTNPLKAIEELAQLKPHVVFLDVNMPQLQGIDAASIIQDRSPDTDVIFITAHAQYAIDAFEVYALDYVLKPIIPERLQHTMERLLRIHPVTMQKNPQDLIIKCFGKFQLSWRGQEPFKWRTQKTRELFLYLLHHQGRRVTKEELVDRLWPGLDLNKAYHQLYNGIYYIKKSLKEYGIDESMITIDSSYCLRLGSIQSDVLFFLENVQNYKKATIGELMKLEESYISDYLEGENFLWADFERERISILYIQLLVRLSECLIEKKAYRQAESFLMKGFQKNPYEESFTELLLTIYAITGKKTKASIHYKNYTKFLYDELNIAPSKKIKELYQSIK